MNADPEIKEILREILKWTKFDGMQKVKAVLETTLDNDTKRLIYHLSDGKPSPIIANIVNVTSQTVRDYWKKWAVLGIMEIHPKYKRRYHLIFSLEEVGIEVPEVKRQEEATEQVKKEKVNE